MRPVQSLLHFSERLVRPQRTRLHQVQQEEPDSPQVLPNITYHLPLCMITLTALEVICFLVEGMRMSEAGSPPTLNGPVPQCSVLIYRPERRWEAWRFLTYGLVHVGYIHLLSNCCVQLMLGVPLELYYGSLRVGGIYLAGVLAGSLGTSLTDPQTLLAGASGGVYALLLAHVPTVVLNWEEMDSIAEWLVQGFVLTVGLVDLAVTIVTRHTETDIDRRIGYSAHLSGALTGLLVGLNLIRNFRHKRWEGQLRVVCLLVWVFAVALAVLWNSLAWALFPPSDWSPLPGRSCGLPDGYVGRI